MVPKFVLFFAYQVVFLKFIIFFENCKNLICHPKLKLKFTFETQVHILICKFKLVLDIEFAMIKTGKRKIYLHCPFEVQRRSIYITRREAKSLRMDGWEIKSILQFSSYVYVYRTCIYVLIKIIENCHQHSYGFWKLMSSWAWWSKSLK